MCSSNLSFSKSTYFWPFMIAPGSRKNIGHSVYGHSTPNHDTWGVFHCLRSVSLVKLLFGGSTDVALARSKLLCCRFIRKKNLLPLLNRPFRCFLAKTKRLAFMAVVSLGFFAGLRGFKPKSIIRRRLTVLRLMSAPFASSTDRILLAKLIGDRIAVLLMMWSSLGMLFR